MVPVDVVPPTIGIYAVTNVRPVPPLSTSSVPARTTAPDVAVVGVRPVVPALKVVTAVVDVNGVSQLNVPDPSVLKTCPLVPSASGNVQRRLTAIASGALKPT